MHACYTSLKKMKVSEHRYLLAFYLRASLLACIIFTPLGSSRVYNILAHHIGLIMSRKRSVAEVLPELQHLPRRDLLSVLKRIRDHSEELLSCATDSYRGLTDDYHANFDLVSCADVFPYADKPGSFNMEYDDPCLLVQHVLTHCTKLAQRWVIALRDVRSGTASNPWRAVVGYDEFLSLIHI